MIRVEVASHFNEDAFSYGLAHGLADRLRAEIATWDCPDQEEDALVLLSTQGIAETLNDITVECRACCEPLAERVRGFLAEVRAELLG